MNRLLIEDWLPIAALGVESLRERTPMTPFPAPNRLHVWFARRPLVASRAAVLTSLLPVDADRDKVLHILGIHGDAVASRLRIDEARHTGVRFAGEAYSYPRAFTYRPSSDELEWFHSVRGGDTPVILDPTAGGGSIPFESVRLGCATIANDLNPVAALVMKATVELPLRFGPALRDRYTELAAEFVRRRDRLLNEIIPAEPQEGAFGTNWLWARTITCPYCGGVVPLSPNWSLNGKGVGVRIKPDPVTHCCGFEIVHTAREQSKGTVKDGSAECPFPPCGRVIEGDEIKSQAQAGRMGHQL